MTNQSGIKKVVAGAVLAGAFSFTSLVGGIASANEPSAPSISEIVVTKDLDVATTGIGGGAGGVWRTTNLEASVEGTNEGTVSGRITGIAIDPSDETSDPEWKYLPVRRFYNPSSSSQADVNQNSVAMETMTIVYEGFDIN